MPIDKPRFPNLNVTDLQQKVSRLEELVESTRAGDGTVDMGALEEKVAAEKDEGLADAFEQVKYDSRRLTGTRSIGGSSPVEVPVYKDAAALDAGEVRSVMSALLSAKAAIGALDGDRDGKLDDTETQTQAHATGELSGAVTSAVVKSVTADYRADLKEWTAAIRSVAYSVRGRQDLDARVQRSAHQHAETPLGAQAIIWGYREKLVRGDKQDVVYVHKDLKKAESSFWQRLFGAETNHLSDQEVCALFGTDDLSQFITDKKASVRNIGGDYEGEWLAGKDLDGVDDLSDPDFGGIPQPS